jgi:molybdopterin synthase sulfur carrier subunit
VRVFAGLQGMIGSKKLEIGLPAGASVESLRDTLTADYPVLEAFPFAIAVAEEIQEPTRRLDDGDVVDLIPPISGG